MYQLNSSAHSPFSLPPSLPPSFPPSVIVFPRKVRMTTTTVSSVPLPPSTPSSWGRREGGKEGGWSWCRTTRRTFAKPRRKGSRYGRVESIPLPPSLPPSILPSLPPFFFYVVFLLCLVQTIDPSPSLPPSLPPSGPDPSRACLLHPSRAFGPPGRPSLRRRRLHRRKRRRRREWTRGTRKGRCVWVWVRLRLT